MQFALPIVSCRNSACVKVVLKKTRLDRHAMNDYAIVRDCWKRIFPEGSYEVAKSIDTSTVRMVANNMRGTIGYVYLCEGYLCNSTSALLSFASASKLFTYVLLSVTHIFLSIA
ncbi:hypothetical protein AB6A40_010930 [Gnathostoma spinigerum]|uniref:Uncharacterized protein n=1 Tax=Gnathostoma spinigerum TaxID=75299 RepID=A0ABD6F237_9BILA